MTQRSNYTANAAANVPGGFEVSSAISRMNVVSTTAQNNTSEWYEGRHFVGTKVISAEWGSSCLLLTRIRATRLISQVLRNTCARCQSAQRKIANFSKRGTTHSIQNIRARNFYFTSSSSAFLNDSGLRRGEPAYSQSSQYLNEGSDKAPSPRSPPPPPPAPTNTVFSASLHHGLPPHHHGVMRPCKAGTLRTP